MTSPIKIGDIIAYPGEKKSGPCMWVELRDGTRVTPVSYTHLRAHET